MYMYYVESKECVENATGAIILKMYKVISLMKGFFSPQARGREGRGEQKGTHRDEYVVYYTQGLLTKVLDYSLHSYL